MCCFSVLQTAAVIQQIHTDARVSCVTFSPVCFLSYMLVLLYENYIAFKGFKNKFCLFCVNIIVTLTIIFNGFFLSLHFIGFKLMFTLYYV